MLHIEYALAGARLARTPPRPSNPHYPGGRARVIGRVVDRSDLRHILSRGNRRRMELGQRQRRKVACNEHRLDGYRQERKPSTQESWHRFAETGEGIQRGGRPFDHLRRSGTAFTGCVKIAPHHSCAPAADPGTHASANFDLRVAYPTAERPRLCRPGVARRGVRKEGTRQEREGAGSREDVNRLANLTPLIGGV
jgi:hypothetical protein